MTIAPKDTTFTRQQIGALTGIADTTLSYWMRESILRPSSGGGGKGQHRRFRFEQVNLAGVLERLRRYGVVIGSLRQVADLFNRAIETFSEWKLSKGERDAVSSLCSDRDEILKKGWLEVPIFDREEFPGRQRHAWTLGGDRKAVRLDWSEAVAYRRESFDGSDYTERAIALAENVDPSEYASLYYLYLIIEQVPEKISSGDGLDYFYIDEGGLWAVAPSIANAPDDVDSFIAIDFNRLMFNIWSQLKQKQAAVAV